MKLYGRVNDFGIFLNFYEISHDFTKLSCLLGRRGEEFTQKKFIDISQENVYC